MLTAIDAQQLPRDPWCIQKIPQSRANLFGIRPSVQYRCRTLSGEMGI